MRLYLQALFWFGWIHYIFGFVTERNIDSLAVRSHLLRPELTWVSLMRILMASFNLMYLIYMCYLIVSSIFYHIKFHPCMLLTFFPLILMKWFSATIQEMEGYIRGLIPNLAQLRDIPDAFVHMYCRIAAHKFFFFCDPHRRGLPWFSFSFIMYLFYPYLHWYFPALSCLVVPI